MKHRLTQEGSNLIRFYSLPGIKFYKVYERNVDSALGRRCEFLKRIF